MAKPDGIQAVCVRDGSSGDWDPALETGMEQIDRQHQALFGQLRALLDCLKSGRIRETFKFMVDSAVEHFKTEEDLHQATGYPRADEHSASHSRFVVNLRTLEREFADREHGLANLAQTAEFLLAWLKKHIQQRDRDFADYFHPLHRRHEFIECGLRG